MPLSADHSSLKIHEVMHPGVIDCPPQTPVSEVVALMAEHSVHCVVVDGLARDRHHNEQLVWGILSDVELMRAISDERIDVQAGSVAATEIVTIAPEDDVHRAAQLMSEHECSHLVVADPNVGRPVGVLSSLDVARALAWGVRPSNTVAGHDRAGETAEAQ
ncbi:MAG TPA: CBS domain-containing protein [Solirubrobacteraceae bacterium]|nr:CBS domain-containing protein [Solirubrobacteraceae bacterium]